MRFLTAFFIICLLAGSAMAGPPQSNPASPPDTTSAMAAPIRFFQKYLSGADGHRCPMIPSCSNYALQAMQRHGAIKGWIITSDRLMRCGRDESKQRPPLITRYGIRYPDSLDDNDFWLD